MDALSNLHSIRADVIEVWDPVALRYKTIQETIVGLPPSTLNSIELVAAAIGNDADYFTSVAEGLDAKAESSYVDSELAARDVTIAAKASTTELTAQLATRDTAIGLKSDLAYVDSELDDIDTAVAGKASSSSVTAIDARLEQTERVVGQDAGQSYHYLQAGEDVLVIQGPNVSALGILGSSAGALEGKALFYKDVLIEGGLAMGALSGGIFTPSLTVDGSTLPTLLAGKENAFTAMSPLKKGFNASGDEELSVDSPFWVAGRINGITETILSSKGRHDFTFERLQQGYYQMTWEPPHPDGANFLCFDQREGTGGT